jgi:hypothetical protein
MQGAGGVITAALTACGSYIYIVDGTFLPYEAQDVPSEYVAGIWFEEPTMTTEQIRNGLDNEPPEAAKNASATRSFQSLPSGQPRHLYCLPPSYLRKPNYNTLYSYFGGMGIQPPPPPVQPTVEGGGGGGGSNAGLIAGVVTGAVVAVAAVAVGLVLYLRRRKRLSSSSSSSSSSALPKKDAESDLAGSSGAGQPVKVIMGDLSSAKRILMLPSRPGPKPEWLELDADAEEKGGKEEEAPPPTPRADPARRQPAWPSSLSGDSTGGQGQQKDQLNLSGASSNPSAGLASPFAGSPFAAAGPIESSSLGGWSNAGSSIPLAGGISKQASGRPSLGGSYGLSELDLGAYASTRQASVTLKDGEALHTAPSGSTVGSGVEAGLGAGGSRNLESVWSAIFSDYAVATAAAGEKASRQPADGTFNICTADAGAMQTTPLHNSGLVPASAPVDDWELDPQDIEICTHADGALVELGAGGFGKVRGEG